MKIYRVGGCVRDQLLGRPVKDRDWVVVGASPQQMQALGYQQVGKDFPVFLHPETHEEYALARTERKTGPGYTGFAFHAAPEVTLQEDLQRRDLTINALAESDDGEITDPYGGLADLQARILRHVSPAFVEDPVRILRVARFATRFAGEGFSVASETLSLMRQMVNNGEVDALVAERVWQETRLALGESKPSRFIEVLRDCGALEKLFPEIDVLFGIPQNPDFHPEIDTGVHTLMVTDQAARLSDDPQVRFAALVHDLGKGVTPREQWPKHQDHDERGVPLVLDVCKRLKVPTEYRELAVLVTRYHLYFHMAAELSAAKFLDLFQSLDAFRRPQRFQQWLFACEADSRGRTGFEDQQPEQTDLIQHAFDAAARVDITPATRSGLAGPAIAEEISRLRQSAIADALR